MQWIAIINEYTNFTALRDTKIKICLVPNLCVPSVTLTAPPPLQ